MMKPNRHFLSALLRTIAAVMLLAVSIPASAASAVDILRSTVATLHKYPSLTASYTLRGGNNSAQGTITVAGKMFMITSKQMQVWYDGKTQWTYLPADREVNISEPDDDAQQVNPFAIIDAYATLYAPRLLKSNEPGKYVIELKPKKGKAEGGITKAVLTVNASNSLPEKVVVTMSGGNVVTIGIASIKSNGAMTAARFRPAKGAFAGAEVIDLR